jgi:hypothetical protein
LPAVADKAQGSEVLQIAFTTALDHRDDMIRVPQGFPADPLETPPREQLLPMAPASPFQIEICAAAIDPAKGANAFIAREYLLTQISRIRSQPPFMDAPVRAKSESPWGDFKITPAAQGTASLPSRQLGSIGKPAGHRPGSAHKTFLA